ncbi:MAG TPA: MFS transporter [Chlamydiales bacterium]|nr:MFS transporter [Chlamydiales bacterium]
MYVSNSNCCFSGLIHSCLFFQVGKIYACEIIPTRLRAKVCAVEQLANWLVNYAVALTAPIFLHSSPSGPYFLYGSATLLAVVVCYFMPETKGRTLEEIVGLFEKGSDGGSESCDLGKEVGHDDHRERNLP